MKIPLISSDPFLNKKILSAIESFRLSGTGKNIDSVRKVTAVTFKTTTEGIEYINYQMPGLLIINFSDKGFSPWEVMEQIVSDPWLNNGGIIAIYEEQETFERLNALKNTNIIVAVNATEIDQYFLRILSIVNAHQQFLFQRSMHKTFITKMSGQFIVDLDIGLVPCYANLVTNYLYNVGFLELDDKNQVNLCLIEMLNNAIEHGNCEISAKEKTEFLAQDFNIKKLIEKKCREFEHISKRKVSFEYDIDRGGSRFIIEDEGDGFDWREYLKPGREIDYLADHGRGILLTQMNANDIAYNEKGNQVTLKISHRTAKANTLPAGFISNELIELEEGDIVCKQGEETSILYYIAEGEYAIEVENQVVAVLTPEDMLIGEMAFLLQEKRSATVRAATKGKLIKISKESFVNTIKEYPYYGVFLSKLLADRLQKVTRKLTS